MKTSLVLSLIFSILFSCGDKNSNKENLQNATEENTDITTYYFIRHAEKDRTDPDNPNPHLNNEGIERANQWADILNDVKFDAVYSTDFFRTRETAKPIASKYNLDVNIYDASTLFNEEFKSQTFGKTVLIVGHSNTTPMFANSVLGTKKYSEMNDLNNGGLYIVTVEDGKATSILRQYD